MELLLELGGSEVEDLLVGDHLEGGVHHLSLLFFKLSLISTGATMVRDRSQGGHREYSL